MYQKYGMIKHTKLKVYFRHLIFILYILFHSTQQVVPTKEHYTQRNANRETFCSFLIKKKLKT